MCQTRDGSDNVTARLYAEGEYRTAGAQKYLYLTDHLGSVRDVVDANTGALLGSLDYSPYGQVQRQSGSVSPVYQFAQLPWDGNAGLSFSPTRLYDASVGRWLSRDPIGEEGGISLYAYVGGSPTLEVDPDGLQRQAIINTLNRLRKLIPWQRIKRCFFPRTLTKADFPPIGTKVSQKQFRHIAGRPEHSARGSGSFLNSNADAQTVLDAYHSGSATILGKTPQGFPVVRFNGVTGTNVNVGAGFPNQPTNVFVIKGTSSPSIVPTNPNWIP